MDLFTAKANEIIKSIKPISEETVVYSSEEDAETTVTPQQMNAIKIATAADADPNDPNVAKAKKLRKNLIATAANILQKASSQAATSSVQSPLK